MTTKTRIRARLAVLLGGLALAAAACGTGNSPTSTGDPAAAQPAASSSSGLAGWWASYQSDWNQVGSDIGKVSADATANNEAQAGIDCTSLSADVGTLQSDPPIPSAAINSPYQQALTDVAQAANDCMNGNYDQAGSEFATAGSLFNEVTGQIKAATGQG